MVQSGPTATFHPPKLHRSPDDDPTCLTPRPKNSTHGTRGWDAKVLQHLMVISMLALEDGGGYDGGLCCIVFSVHPSIHFLYPLNPSVGSRSSGERQGTPWTGRRSITGPHRDKRDKQPHTLTLTPKDKFRVTN